MDSVLYGWYNRDWRSWFYVGRGSTDRARTSNGRSPRFSQIFRNHDYETCEIMRGSEKEIEVAEPIAKYILKTFGEAIVDGEAYESHRIAQRAGIEAAKKRGVYKGRKPIDINKALFEVTLAEVRAGDRTNRSAMKKLDLKPNTYYKAIKEFDTKTGRWA